MLLKSSSPPALAGIVSKRVPRARDCPFLPSHIDQGTARESRIPPEHCF